VAQGRRLTGSGGGAGRRWTTAGLFRGRRDASIGSRGGATLVNRQAGQPDHVLAISNRAQQRLHKVNRTMRARGKPHNVTVVACARELSLLPLGRRHRRLTPATASPAGRPERRAIRGRHARHIYEQPHGGHACS
jgi:hypothetical protein